MQPIFYLTGKDMMINNCNTANYNANPLKNAQDCCNRFRNEIATCEFDKQGRLLSLYGNVKYGADYMEIQEKEACTTLLADKIPSDLDRMIAIFVELPGTIENIFKLVPLFRDRDYVRYPKLKPEDVPAARKRLEAMEILPLCGDRKAKKTMIDATEFAFIMKDLIFFDLNRIIQSFKYIVESEKMLKADPDKRNKLYQLMAKDYQENEWKNDQQYIREELDDYIRQHGYTKESLQTFLKCLERDALNYAKHGDVATINYHYLNQNSHVSYIYHSRHQLTQHDIRLHLYFVNSRKMVMQEVELFDLRQPAVGAYKKLFKNRAAKELADLLVPIIAFHVDFNKDYHYAAYALAMKDSGLIQAKKPNGTLTIHYVKVMFNEQIDKSILSRHTKISKGFKKIEDQYHLILSIINQALGREPMGENNYFQNQDEEFYDRLETLKKAL